MKNFPQVSLRYLVPLIIILVAVLLSGFLYFTTKPELLKTAENHAKENIQALLNRVQGPIETLLRYENIDAVKSVIASFGAEPGHELMFLTDVQGNIIAATKLELLNKHSTELSEYQNPDLITQVLETRGTATRLSANKLYVFGYSSICAGQDVQIIRPKDCGVLYYRQNINNQKALALAGLNKETVRESIGIITAAFIVWLVVYFRLTRRVEQLITTGKKFTLGDRSARSRITGTDELASVGNTFDTMIDKIIADEKALSKSEARQRAIIETSVEAIITIDTAGITHSINTAAEKLFAYTAKEVIGNNISMLMPMPYQQEHDTYIKNYLTSGEAKIIGIGREVEGRRKDGTVFPIWLAVGEFFEDEQRFFAGFIRDLTIEKSYLEKALRYESILENSLNEFYIFEADTLHFIRANQGALENLQYSRDEILKLTPIDIKPEYSSETFLKLIKPLRTGEQDKIVFTTVHQRKDGSHYPVEVHLELAQYEAKPAFVAIILDISQRKKTEDALRLREEEIRLIFNNAPAGIALADLDGSFLNVNPALCTMLGYSEAELLEMSFIEITHRDDIIKSQASLTEFLNANLEGYKLDKRYIHKNGSIVYVQLNVAVVHDANQQPAMLIVQIEDVTEVIKAAEYSRLQQEQLAHMDRLSMMGEMAAGIAHEINQPLTAIDSYAQAAKRRTQSDPIDIKKLQDLLEKISKTSVRAGDVINNLRELLKRQPKSRNYININALINDTVNIAEMDTRALEFKVEIILADKLPTVMADTVQIQQVILNLIRNAMDAAAKESDQYKVITISSLFLAAKDRIQVSVKDYGSGLDKENAEQVFNPFYTTKPSGMGMGLAISHSIVQEHGGRLWYTRNSDKGTTFHFTLPTALDDENE